MGECVWRNRLSQCVGVPFPSQHAGDWALEGGNLPRRTSRLQERNIKAVRKQMSPISCHCLRESGLALKIRAARDVEIARDDDILPHLCRFCFLSLPHSPLQQACICRTPAEKGYIFLGTFPFKTKPRKADFSSLGGPFCSSHPFIAQYVL